MLQPDARAKRPLQALNFFMADMQAGLGPFLGVFLLAHGWRNGSIGTVMSLGAFAGLLVTAPAGALVDSSSHKRSLVVASGLCTVFASAAILLSQSFWSVAASQVATALAGALIGPAVIGMTLGICRRAGFQRQNGINQAYNHAGNAVGAGMSGLLGWRYGLPAVFWLAVAFAAASIVCIAMIPRDAIDDRAARGLQSDTSEAANARGLAVLWSYRPLFLLALSLALFHLGNAAMLPLFGMAVAAARQGDPAMVVGATIVVAQATMVAAALFALYLAKRRGYWQVMLISFAALPVRGVVAACCIESWGVLPVQVLDGIGAGLQSVAVPALVVRLLDGTGRVNAGQGAVLTAQGLGASLSPFVGGWLADWSGYGMAFIILGGVAAGSLFLWLRFADRSW